MRRAAGSVSARGTDALTPTLSRQRRGRRYRSGPTTIYLVDRPGAPQSVIRAVHSLVPRSHPDYFALAAGQLLFWRPVLGAAQPEPAPGQGIQLRIHVLHPVAPPPFGAGGRRLGAEQRHRGVGLRDAQGVPGGQQRASHHPTRSWPTPRTGMLRAYPCQLRAARFGPGTVGVDRAVRLARRLLPHRPPVTRRPSPWTTYTAPPRPTSAPATCKSWWWATRASVEGPLSELGLPAWFT